MSDQQSISVLPQTGHGRFAVRDALFIEEAKLFISLDEAGALILWDYSTSQQLAALSFPAGKPKPGKLRYEEETLYAFGSLAIYRWAAELNQWQPLPDQTSDERQEVSGPIRQLGLYALLGPPQTLAARAGATVCSSAAGAIELIYLPLVLE